MTHEEKQIARFEAIRECNSIRNVSSRPDISWDEFDALIDAAIGFFEIRPKYGQLVMHLLDQKMK